MKKQKVLVTGGAGFIGSNLCRHLLDEGNDVTVVDDLSTGRIENIKSLQNKNNFEFVRQTVRNAPAMNDIIEKCDVIYHLAAAVGVNLIVDEPVHTIETNIGGTEVVLKAANKFKKKILLVSSSEVYGKNEKVPFCEDDDTLLGSTRFPRWSYASSKMIDEFLGLAYHKQYNLDVIITRFFNIIGPRQSGQYGMVVPRFIQWVLNNEPLLIYGTGKQSRCFLYVQDLIKALTSLIGCDKAAGEVFNIGSDEEITIEALADMIIEKAKSKSVKKYVSYEQAYGAGFDDTMRRVPSLEKIKRSIGFDWRMTLSETLDAIIAHFKAAQA